ncbi:Phosphotransferase enzyme family [Aspergillus sclerotialis]|uniref:Phosphotransferase enzyme family n=1 Tax=Aspergillus sclerotialis TaxID=2070753 RepID=A0A3A2Z0V9_9EURO|nr:Phosphotransferase enzyme family [Aspergillus sclerotialis]
MQKLKMWLKMSLQTTSDGWIPNEVWNAAQGSNRAAYAQWIEVARASEASDEDMTVRRAGSSVAGRC